MSKRTEITYVLENLHFLLDSGIPLVGCLDILSKKNSSPKIIQIKEGILQGKTFREALLVAYENKIPHMMNMFIQIGESCGNLDAMLAKAIDTDRQIKKINSSFIGALSYPLFICVVALLMMLLTMIGIVPKLMPMFRDLQVELPVYTRFFMASSNLIVHYGFYAILGLFTLGILFIYFFKKSQKFRASLENLILNTWGIRSLYVRYHTSIIALCISEYLKSGYAFHDALKMVGESVNSYAYEQVCFSISYDLQNGKSLSEAVNLREKMFPGWSHVLGLASQTGRLPEQFERFYLENVTYLEKTNTLVKRWSEPALMLFIGGIIAVFAVSIISPIYSVVQNVRI
jgi:type II secretory pathway component PulF